MKNLKSILKLFVLALAALWIASCSNSFDVAEGATGGAAQPAGHVKVMLGSVVSKTILPGDWDNGHKSALTYYLSGTGTLPSGATKTLAATELDYGKITTTGQEIELSPGTWALTLSAYQLTGDPTPAPAATNMVLTATNTGIDLTSAGAPAVFNLKPVASTNAKGTVNITGSVNCGPYLKWVVQDVGTYSGSTFTSAGYEVSTDVSTSTATSTSYNFTYNKDVVAANNYYYVITFYNGDPNDGGQSLGRYREALVVDGGNLSSKTIPLGDFLNSPATNPTQLFVNTSFENVGQASTAAVPGTFLASFTWNTDNCGNETGYELKIYQGTVSEGVITYPEAATYTIKKGAVNIGTGAGEVKAGSGAAGADPTMGKDEGQIGVYLNTGATYKASIRAYNRYDELDAADIPTKVTKVNNVTGTDMVYGMFTVAYTLGDANALVQEDDTNANNSSMYVIGYNYNTEAQNLMGYVANGSTSDTYPYVTVSTANKTFKKWITTVASQTSDQMDAAEEVTTIAAGNITNLKLTGVWKSVTNVTVAFPSYTALNSAVWIKSYQIDTAAAVNVASNAAMTISAPTRSVIVFTYDETMVDNIWVLSDNGRDDATTTIDTTAHTVTINTGSLTDAEGHWQITISGDATYTDSFGDTATRSVSQNFNIILN